jgi:membrane-bound inhibitor of C-type lysozyme
MKAKHRSGMQRFFWLVLLSTVSGCATGEHVGVQLGKPICYHGPDGKRFVARYGGLSDGSLAFVTVTMPDGQALTLPAGLSASGVRYTDGREYVWWEHQGTVRVDIRRDDGTWDEAHWILEPERKID